ncbi:MAG: methylaspartate mutase, partial [Planctomycetota bacterium]
ATCFSYSIQGSSLHEQGEIKVGEMKLFELGPDDSATVSITPAKGFDVGAGSGKPREETVRGGTVGLVLDGRGRSISIPEDRAKGRPLVEQWINALEMYPSMVAHA